MSTTILEAIGGTPLLGMRSVTPPRGGRVFAKLESGNRVTQVPRGVPTLARSTYRQVSLVRWRGRSQGDDVDAVGTAAHADRSMLE